MRAHVYLVVGVAAVMSLAPRAARAVGEQVGRVRGRITDAASGAPLPAVTVTARGPALIGGPRTTLTSDDGRYELDNLPPGAYTMEITYEGTVPLVRQIVVRSGEASPLNVAWSLELAGMETVAVVDRLPATKPDSTQTGTILDSTTLNRLPTSRAYQDVALRVPGVSTSLAGEGNTNIKGGLLLNNRYLIDGLDVTDPVLGTFTQNLTFDMIESIDVLTGGMEAQYNAMGGVINVITKGGSDSFHSNASLYANHHKLSAKGNYGPNVYDGRQPFNDTESGPNQGYQANVNVGGPIIKRRLWYSASYELRSSESSTVKSVPLGVAPFNIQHPPQTRLGHLFLGKLAFAPSAKHRLTLTASAAPLAVNNAAGGNHHLGVAESRQNQRNIFTVAAWDWYLRDNVSTNLQVGFLRNVIEAGPQGRLGKIDRAGCEQFTIMDNCTYDRNRPRHVNLVDGTAWYQGGDYQHDTRYKLQAEPSVKVRVRLGGLHDIKAGVQAQLNYREGKFERPGGSTFFDGGSTGQPLEAGLCDPKTGAGCYFRQDVAPFTSNQTSLGAGIYLQDRWWTPAQWLTVVPGLRLDYGYTADRKGRTVTSLLAAGPRLGVIADVTRDSRNVVFAYYGRHTDTVSLLAAANADSRDTAVTDLKAWNMVENDFTSVSRTGGEGGVIIDHEAKTPHSDEVTLGARREVFINSAAGVDYTWKRISNLWADIESNRIWDPTGFRSVGWVDPTKMDQNVLLYTTPDDNQRTYQGIDFWTQGRPSPNWDYGASYTLSWIYGHATSMFSQVTSLDQFDNPRQSRFYDGFLEQDIRHYVRLWGSYRFLQRCTLGGSFDYVSGSPITKTHFNAATGGYNNYRSPIGTHPGSGNDPNAITELRTPDRVRLDLRLVTNLLPARLDHRMQLIFDVFNAFNLRAPIAVATADLPTFGQVTARQSPLRIQVALNYLY